MEVIRKNFHLKIYFIDIYFLNRVDSDGYEPDVSDETI